MKTKAEVISDVIKSGCTLPEQALKKLKKKELQVILNKYTKPKAVMPIPKANVSLREFTDSEEEEEKPINNKIVVKFKTPHEDDLLPKNAPILQRQNAMEKTRKEHQTELKKICNNFSLFISDMIKQFKEDNDAEYVVHTYNTTRADVETEITDYLENWAVSDDIYEYANSLLEIQKGRIERLLGMR